VKNKDQSHPKTQHTESYQSISGNVSQDSNKQNAKTYSIGPRLNAVQLKNFQSDPDSIKKAHQDPVSSEKYNLLKEKGLDVKIGLLDGKPVVIVKADQIKDAKKILDNNGYVDKTEKTAMQQWTQNKKPAPELTSPTTSPRL